MKGNSSSLSSLKDQGPLGDGHFSCVQKEVKADFVHVNGTVPQTDRIDKQGPWEMIHFGKFKESY